MTPQRYISDRLDQGAQLTHIVGELACITATSERTMWRWIKGDGIPSGSALKLIRIWYQLTPEERERVNF